MYDERFCRMWEFYLVSAEMMFRTGSQLVFHMQLARKRDAAPIVRDYITDVQRLYRDMEDAKLEPLRGASRPTGGPDLEAAEPDGQSHAVPVPAVDL
jgi:cyclopropane-fatty-acyl-phospholipid synthase